VRPGTVEIVAVRVAPVPPKETLLFGTSLVSEELALTVKLDAGVCASPTVRLTRPLLSLKRAPPAATAIVGALFCSTSNAPLSQAEPCGRVTRRWSEVIVVPQPFVPCGMMSMAGPPRAGSVRAVRR